MRTKSVAPTKERPKRKRKPKSYKEDYDSEENERPSDRDSNDNADSLFGDENVDDPDFDEEMSDDDDNFSLDMFYSDEEEHDLDMSLVKEEIDTIQVWSCNSFSKKMVCKMREQYIVNKFFTADAQVKLSLPTP